MNENLVRRPIATRNAKWASSIARWLGKIGIRPNHISIASAVFAACSGACFLMVPSATSSKIGITLFVFSAFFIQLRLLCNLFDGMVAVEGGFKTKSGEIFNDLPDRIADPLILISAGYAIPHFIYSRELGWLAGLLAVLTAYARVLGGSCGAKQDFVGPMAKQHRMAVMTTASLIAALEMALNWPSRIIAFALVMINVGCIVTVIRRVHRTVAELESK